MALSLGQISRPDRTEFGIGRLDCSEGGTDLRH